MYSGLNHSKPSGTTLYITLLNDFEKTLRIDNSIAEAYLQKANCFYMLEDYKTALFELKRASRMFLGKNADVIRFIGELEFRGGDFESAEAAVERLKLSADLCVLNPATPGCPELAQ